MKTVILLSTYNGEKYLVEQLDSLYNQSYKKFDILIRDDGSSDNTINIIKDYCQKHKNISYYEGNNIGPAKSFFDLINHSDKYDYYALCDQDDVWFKDKLEVAINTLKDNDNNIPLLYASKYTLTDEALNPINSKVSSLYNYSDFPHSLIYNSAPGCTFVFNKAARDKIVQYDINKQYYVIHDAIIHKVVAMFGKFILDNDSHMYYRQHNTNEIGMSANPIKVFFGRINRFLNGKMKNYRSNSAKALLNVYGDDIDKSHKHLLDIIANYKTNKEYKKELLNNHLFKTNTINDIFFKILVMFNYI